MFFILSSSSNLCYRCKIKFNPLYISLISMSSDDTVRHMTGTKTTAKNFIRFLTTKGS